MYYILSKYGSPCNWPLDTSLPHWPPASGATAPRAVAAVAKWPGPFHADPWQPLVRVSYRGLCPVLHRTQGFPTCGRDRVDPTSGALRCCVKARPQEPPFFQPLQVPVDKRSLADRITLRQQETMHGVPVTRFRGDEPEQERGEILPNRSRPDALALAGLGKVSQGTICLRRWPCTPPASRGANRVHSAGVARTEAASGEHRRPLLTSKRRREPQAGNSDSYTT